MILLPDELYRRIKWCNQLNQDVAKTLYKCCTSSSYVTSCKMKTIHPITFMAIPFSFFLMRIKEILSWTQGHINPPLTFNISILGWVTFLRGLFMLKGFTSFNGDNWENENHMIYFSLCCPVRIVVQRISALHASDKKKILQCFNSVTTALLNMYRCINTPSPIFFNWKFHI